MGEDGRKEVARFKPTALSSGKNKEECGQKAVWVLEPSGQWRNGNSRLLPRTWIRFRCPVS